jgi:hypothetical protein
MRLRELVPADLGPMSEPRDIVKLFGSPAFVYMDLVRTSYNWLRARARRGDARFYSHRLHHVWSYIRTSLRIFATDSNRGVPAELRDFIRGYLRKRRHAKLNRTVTEPDPLLHSSRHRG